MATLAPAEEFKADAAGEIAALRSAGYELYLLSGDAQVKVDRAAAALGLPADRAEGDLDPEAKAARVRALDNHDTLMVGDGLNDSPSFAAAWCAATPAVDRPVLPGKADFFFLGDGIAAIGRSLWEARRLRRVVRDNLVIAIVYNVVAVACCAAGLVTPVAAAIFMPASSLAVVTLTAVRVSRGSSWM
ncbi:MAG: HAD family hydrolase [bacterium]|nr:HAD family hydrolase [bacterium]